jgi:hypothetical protein
MKIEKFDVTEFLDSLKKAFDKKVADRLSGDIAQTVSMMFDYSLLEAVEQYSKKLEEKEKKK